MGTIPTALTAVTMKADSVISRTSHPRAIMVMKKDTMEARDAAQKMRNWGSAKARKGPSRETASVPFTGGGEPLELMVRPRFQYGKKLPGIREPGRNGIQYTLCSPNVNTSTCLRKRTLCSLRSWWALRQAQSLS